MIFRVGCFSLFLFLAFPVSSFALKIPDRPEGYVSDYAGMLSPAAAQDLENKLRGFEEATSNQVVVVTFLSLEGEVLEDFSIRLAEEWKIGQKGKDNGVILLIFKNDRQVRIEVGYGLEGVLTDATSKIIIENEIVPRFRQGKFEEGIYQAVDGLMAAAQGEYRQGSTKEVFNGDLFALILIGGFFLSAVLSTILIWIFSAGSFLGAVVALAGGQFVWAGGLGLLGLILPVQHYFLVSRRNAGILDHGGFYSSRSRSGWGGGFGGGGFSGGGGSFGGGGASGSW